MSKYDAHIDTAARAVATEAARNAASPLDIWIFEGYIRVADIENKGLGPKGATVPKGYPKLVGSFRALIWQQIDDLHKFYDLP